MIHSATGEDGLKFFPFVFTLFIFVLFSNFFGMIPGSFTVTSQIAVTFALACLVILTGDRDRLRQARHRLPEAVRAAGALVSADPAGADRGDLVPAPARSAFRSVCSPTCWPATPCWRCSRGFVVSLGARGRRALAALDRAHAADRRDHAAGTAGRVPAGLCLRDPDLHLSQRSSSSPRSITEPEGNLHNGTSQQQK